MTLKKKLLIIALDIFQKVNKQKKLNKTRQKINDKFILNQEEVNQTQENKTKNYRKTIKNGLLVDFVFLNDY